MAEIIPAVLPQTYTDIQTRANKVCGLTSCMQIDVVDGKFAPSMTWPYSGDDGSWKKLQSQEIGLPHWDELSYEIDLMVSDPVAVVEKWILAGAETLIIHIESFADAEADSTGIEAILKLSFERQVAVALALNPSTPITSVEKWFDDIAFVQCMGSDHVGSYGASLDERIFQKIQDLRAQYSGPIAVDIGVSRDTAPKLLASGATRLVSGSAIFKEENVVEAIHYFQNL